MSYKTYEVKVYDDGRLKEWYLNGKRHREDGPAVEYSNGEKSWWLNGNHYTEAQWKVELNKTCDGKVVEIKGVKYKLKRL